MKCRPWALWIGAYRHVRLSPDPGLSELAQSSRNFGQQVVVRTAAMTSLAITHGPFPFHTLSCADEIDFRK